MSDNFSKWLGGPNFIKAQQWGCGRSNDGGDRKGMISMRRRRRFNPNYNAPAASTTNKKGR